MNRKEPGSMLVFDPIADFSSVNLVRGKPSSPSSTFFNGQSGFANSSLANDGIWESHMKLTTGRFMCATTNSEQNNWWMVNLEHIYILSKVVILNRSDCCSNRLSKLAITVGETESNMHMCATYDGPGGKGELVNITCQTSVSGQFVKIRQSDSSYLQLCEVGVYC
ncbi:fucolectin-3-like [Mercenaria mercenaria]|uniref:fucolectin-3-like n=1 Tax=Mercenaria mercenaria TaxID=6596 RepID=UPI00234F135C|nr:fucolectin-3-like [Mercenaria mercenaria]